MVNEDSLKLISMYREIAEKLDQAEKGATILMKFFLPLRMESLALVIGIFLSTALEICMDSLLIMRSHVD
jgi:hypothetical protein